MTEIDELRARLVIAKELCDELRGYTHDWDWKYGADWDEQRRALDDGRPIGEWLREREETGKRAFEEAMARIGQSVANEKDR